MPNNIIQQAVYADPENMNEPSLTWPGNLGCRFTVSVPFQVTATGPVADSGASKSYQIVRTDSGMGVSPTRGMVAWWKNKATYLVTTDQLGALNRNSVAGIFKNSVTSGNHTAIQFGGPAYVQVTLASVGAVVSGDSLIPSAADNGRADRVAAGTAVTYTKIGTADGTVAATNLILATLQLPALETT